MPVHEGEEAGLSARSAPAFAPDYRRRMHGWPARVTETGARLPEIGSNGGRRRRGTVASRLHTEPFTPINSPTKRVHHADE